MAAGAGPRCFLPGIVKHILQMFGIKRGGAVQIRRLDSCSLGESPKLENPSRPAELVRSLVATAIHLPALSVFFSGIEDILAFMIFHQCNQAIFASSDLG
jgi:hypothetical protein